MSTMKATLPNGVVLELSIEQAIQLGIIPGTNVKSIEKPAEKQAVSRGKKRAKPAKAAVRTVTPIVKSSLVSNDGNTVRDAITLLMAIQESGRQGIPAGVVTGILGVNHPKGISSKSAGINKLLDDLPFRRSSVYTNDRTVNGRIWKPGKNLPHALAELEKLATSH